MKIYNVQQVLDICEEAFRGEERVDDKVYFNCLVTLIKIPEEIFYKACSSDNCRKKVQPQGDVYFCSQCGEVNTFKPRFLSNLTFCDYSAQLYLTCIGDKDFRVLFNNKSE